MNKETGQWIVPAVLFLGMLLLIIKGAEQNMQMARMSRAMMQIEQRLQVGSNSNPVPDAVVLPTPAASNVFDPKKNQVGDQLVGMRVTSIAAIDGIPGPLGTENVKATFSGPVTLTGHYIFEMNDMAGSEMTCLQVTDPAERAKLPVLVGHPDQNGGFCFKNEAEAKSAFGPAYGEGQATVTIDQYELWYAPAEVGNQAMLKTVVSKTPAKSR